MLVKLPKPPNKAKYRNVRVRDEGYLFDSKREHHRFLQLRILERGGKIRELVVHPSWPIVIKGIPICKVVLDFAYYDVERKISVYEDAKGKDLPMSRLKRKLFEADTGLKVTLV